MRIWEDGTEMNSAEIGRGCEPEPSGSRQGPWWAVMNMICKLPGS
jgi:hypothetical protein